jgi:sarcosine oxidase subunit alpha
MLVADRGASVAGHVTAAAPRVLGEGGVALALLRGGRGRNGEMLLATSPTRGVEARVTVTEPLFYDLEGARYRG